MDYVIHTKAKIDALEAAIDVQMGCPVEGHYMAPGQHSPHDRITWAGWSLHYAHRIVLADGRHALMVHPQVQALIDAGKILLPLNHERRPVDVDTELPPRPPKTTT